MERAKKVLRTLLFPKAIVIVICVLVAAALLIYTFGFYGESGIVAFVSYVFSAYALVILCIGLCSVAKRVKDRGVMQHAKDRVMELANQNHHISRYLTDALFKTKASLLLSLVLNVGYAVLKFVAGIFYGSPWLITLAAYYVLLMTVRFLLLRHMNRNTSDRIAEWKRYRACGVVLIFMNIVLIGMVVLVLRRNEGFAYAGYLIYVMALYDFYTMTRAVVHLIKSRKQNSPVLTAAKVINVAAALITMLSLETAMLTQFGGDSGPAFRHNMIAYTGGCICIILVAMAVFMIAKATRSIKRMNVHPSQTSE